MDHRVPAGLLLSFAALTAIVVATGDLPGEVAVLERVATYDGVDGAARVVDGVTGYLPMSAVAVLVAAVVRGTRGLRVAAAVLVACLGNAVLKALVERPRPAFVTSYGDVSAFSYPSGHATATAALAVAVVLVARGRRWTAAAVLLVVVAAAAQLLLGRHHPSDLLAGWLWGSACAVLAARSGRDDELPAQVT